MRLQDVDRHIQPPRQQSWNVSVQRQFGDNLAASVTYIGTFQDRGWNVRSLNEGVYIPGACTLQTPTGPRTFNPCSTTQSLQFRRRLTMQNFETGKFLGTVDEHTALAEQRYNGLLLSVQRRSANGVSVSANYTLSKCEGTATATTFNQTSAGYSIPDDPDFDAGYCDQDRTHLGTLNAGYQTPEVGNGVVRAVAPGGTRAD